MSTAKKLDMKQGWDEHGLSSYAQHVASGQYDRPVGGLCGRHDNVRAYWEDQLTRFVLRPHVKGAMRQCQREGRGVRILDLGCGTGQGMELLTRIRRKDVDLGVEQQYVLTERDIELYLGLDLSDAMVRQGNANYQDMDNVAFVQGDLAQGLRPVHREPPFDIYFSSYGALSHLDHRAFEHCLGDILKHAHKGSVVVLDLVGLYSPEWSQNWGVEEPEARMLPYSMSYLATPLERAAGKVEQFPLRYWSGSELRATVEDTARRMGVDVAIREMLDRSLFVGRHVDTREYQCLVSTPLRRRVNSLLELNVRTPLESLRTDYKPLRGFERQNQLFKTLAESWNRLVDFTQRRLQGQRPSPVNMRGWRDFPLELHKGLMNMDRIIDSVTWINVGDARANIIEPQLAYELRNLEYGLQKGWGGGHGLVAVLEVGARR